MKIALASMALLLTTLACGKDPYSRKQRDLDQTEKDLRVQQQKNDSLDSELRTLKTLLKNSLQTENYVWIHIPPFTSKEQAIATCESVGFALPTREALLDEYIPAAQEKFNKVDSLRNVDNYHRVDNQLKGEFSGEGPYAVCFKK